MTRPEQYVVAVARYGEAAAGTTAIARAGAIVVQDDRALGPESPWRSRHEYLAA